MGNRVAVLNPEGQFGTVDEADAEAVTRAGGRVLSGRETTAKLNQLEYDAQPLAKKAAGVASSVLAGPIVSSNLSATGVAPVDPSVEAFQAGVSSAATGGLDQVATKGIVEMAAGKKAGDAYAKHVLDVKDAHSGMHTAGELTGFAAMALGGGPRGGAGLTRLVPGLGISGAGAAAEGLAARGLARVAARGVVGRAVATGGELAARGAVEGALYGATQEFTEESLGDKNLAADKIFAAAGMGALLGGAGGGVLGAGGSLGKSAVKGVAGSLSRAIGKAEPAALAEVRAEAKAAPLLEETAGKAAPEAVAPTKAAAEAVTEAAPKSVTKDFAYDRAWRAAPGRKSIAAEAEARLPNGVKDIGEVRLRYNIIDAEAGVIDAAKAGTPEALLNRHAEPIAKVGLRLGEIAEASGGKVASTDILAAVNNIADPLSKKAGFGHIERSVRGYGDDLLEKLGLMVTDSKTGARVLDPNASTSVQKLLEQRKALDELVYKEAKALDPGGRVEALRELRGGVEELITKSLDDSSGKVAGELRSEWNSLKRDYHALKLSEKAAEDIATRGAANRTFSLTDKIIGTGVGAVGSLIGGPIGGFIAGPVAAGASKVIRERADAAVAALLYKSERIASLAKAMKAIDEQFGKATKGMLTPPAKAPLPEATPTEPARARAVKAMKEVAEFQADPDKFATKIAHTTEPLAASAPELAGGLAQRATMALSFLSSKMPVSADHDPFDPHPAPKMTDAQAAEFARYHWYTQRPARFFEEMSRGKYTWEGAEVARALMPDAFAEMQTRMADALATHLARGRAVPFQQRVKIDMLLDMQTVPARRPEHMTMLQANVGVLPSPENQGPTAPRPRANTKVSTQRSPLDALEANGPGRR